jgi:hexosaminidase
MTFFAKGWAMEPSRPALLPLPAQVLWKDGSFQANASLPVSLSGPRSSLVQGALERFQERLAKRTDGRPGDGTGKTWLVLEWKKAEGPLQKMREDESYRLEVSGEKVTLSAPTPYGILHGLETLLQLVRPDGQKGFTLSSVLIEDAPRFPWRGLMIDACRHWMPPEVIRRNLDAMAEAKLNVFHWHLSENQGFRVECKAYPKLHGMGSNGNYYTQDQVRELIAYAKARGIRVVPEFDLPGHSTAWLVGYPELASAPGPYEIEKRYGVFDPCLDPTKEEVYRFLDGFIGEMAALFPDEYFHIGGDEVNGKHWNVNADIQRFMAKHDLKTNDDLQAYFNGKLARILEDHGKRMVGWDEILQGHLPQKVTVQSWRGAEALAQSAKQGFEGLLSNGFYLDLAHPASAYYAVDPLPEGSPLSVPEKARILGGEACMWTELTSPENVDSRIWPASLAVAERLWSPASVTDVEDFYGRMREESARLEDLGLTHRSGLQAMRHRLVGSAKPEALETFASALEPIKDYQRHRWGAYTSDHPLDRLVDSIPPESLVSRDFRRKVDAYLAKAPRFTADAELEDRLKEWEKNDDKVAPLLERSDLLADSTLQSKDLAAIARFALEALGYLKKGEAAPASWDQKAQAALDRAAEPKAQMELAALPALRKLVLAAQQLGKLKELSPADWNKTLDDPLTSKPKK